MDELRRARSSGLAPRMATILSKDLVFGRFDFWLLSVPPLVIEGFRSSSLFRPPTPSLSLPGCMRVGKDGLKPPFDPADILPHWGSGKSSTLRTSVRFDPFSLCPFAGS